MVSGRLSLQTARVSPTRSSLATSRGCRRRRRLRRKRPRPSTRSSWRIPRCQGDAKGMPSWCQGDAKGMPRGCQGDAKGMPRGCQGDAKGMPRGCQGDAKGTCCPWSPSLEIGRAVLLSGRCRRFFVGFWSEIYSWVNREADSSCVEAVAEGLMLRLRKLRDFGDNWIYEFWTKL